jgi:phage-related tail protein
MKKDASYFYNEFERQMKKNKLYSNANIVYGSNVMSILKMYKDLKSEEKKEYLEALENLLASFDIEKRRFAIDICLGFFVFRDSI